MNRLIDLVVGRGSQEDRAALWLRFGLSVSCIGYASQLYRQKLEVNTDALEAWGASSWLASLTPAVGAVGLIMLAVSIWRRPTQGALLGAFAVIAGLTAMATLQFGPYFGLTPPSRAARYLLPIGLLLVIQRSEGLSTWWTSARTANLLRAAVALTFIGHGTKALFHSQKFLDLLSSSQENLIGRNVLGADASLVVLDAVGLVDLTVAVLVILTRWRWVPLYLSAWTFVTASSRVLANGLLSWDDIAIRAGYYTVPLAILCLWAAERHAEQTRPTGPPRPTSASTPSRLATTR